MSGAINGGAGSTLTKTGNGILNITGAQTYDNLVTGGGATSVTSLSTTLGTGTSTITANATLNIYASQTLASLTIGDGVEVVG